MISAPDPMAHALAEARLAFEKGEVPVGAVITDETGQILCQAHNLVETTGKATAHAELLALHRAMEIMGQKQLANCDIWVTLEPCAMCAGALAHARIRRLYFAASDPKGGAVDHGPCIFNQPTTHHRPEIYGGIQQAEAADLLRAFFQQRRDKN